jgi:NAD(P)-dependent dehydrogenase (short-subunit alcohol dehydrogenase family)
MDLNLKGRRAVVTGSTGGIGYAAARELASMGATVAINGRTAIIGRRRRCSAGWRRSRRSKNMIAYVCSPAASATSGAALRVDGGVVRAIP